MKIAYLILTHDQLKMFKRLIGALDSPFALFSVHVDRKAAQADFVTSCQTGKITFERDRSSAAKMIIRSK